LWVQFHPAVLVAVAGVLGAPNRDRSRDLPL
jgi:hypothetical protein